MNSMVPSSHRFKLNSKSEKANEQRKITKSKYDDMVGMVEMISFLGRMKISIWIFLMLNIEINDLSSFLSSAVWCALGLDSLSYM